MSWVIVNKQTREAVFETFSSRLVEALNTEKYEAIEAGTYLGELNRRIKAAGGVQP